MDTRDVVAELRAFHRVTQDPEVVNIAENCLVDVFGCMLAASVDQRFRNLVQSYPRTDGDAFLVGSKKGVDPGFSCLANGFAAHVFDYDDSSYVGLVHPSATVCPAIIAAASLRPTDGLTFLRALAVGIHIQCIIGGPPGDKLYALGWWNTGLFGPVGAAAAVAVILDLSDNVIAHALTASLTMATGTKGVFGSDYKPLGVGLAARAGLEAALLARAGFVGPHDFLESDAGFLRPRGITPADLRPSPADPVREPGIAFKPWPLCSASHAAIEALETILAQVEWNADAISQITVEVKPFVRSCLIYDRPQTPQHAQFSLPFALAITALGQSPTLADLNYSRLQEPTITRLMEKVAIRVSDNIEGLTNDLSHQEGARVTVHARDGSQHTEVIPIARGQTSRPLSTTDIDRKFMANTSHAYYPHDADHLLRALRNIAVLEDVSLALRAMAKPAFPMQVEVWRTA